MKKILSFKCPDFKPFMERRLEIQRLHFLVLLALYMVSYFIFKPIDTPIFSVVLTILASPLLIFSFYFRTSSFFFVRNWFYLIYLAVASGLFIYAMSFFGDNFYEDKYASYEFAHVFASAIIGYGIACAVSVPFKLIQFIIFDTDFFYMTSEFLQKIEYEAFPEKKKKDMEKKQGKFRYDTMNETQLEVELNNAIKNDRFEEAEAIKKVLEKKFKSQ